jgi:hypothetical protein
MPPSQPQLHIPALITIPIAKRLPRFLLFKRHQLHALSARDLNALDRQPGRRVWFQYFDSHITFTNSFLPRLKYVHHSLAHHGVVRCAEDYPWCSAAWFARTAASGFRKTVESFKTNTLSVTDSFVPMAPPAPTGESGVKPPHSKPLPEIV